MNEPLSSQPAPVRVSCNISHTFYANAFNVTAAQGEIAIILGLNPGQASGNRPATVQFSDCVVLSPSTAQRLVAALERVLEEHESRQAALRAQASMPAGTGDIAALGGAPTYPALHVAASKAELLLELVEQMHVEYGLERSFRICTGSLQGGRLLLSLHKSALAGQNQKKFAELCKRMEMPADLLKGFKQHLDEARIIHLGFEGHGSDCIYKVYLERGAAIQRKAAAKGGALEPYLLHLAFKWDPQNPGRRFLTKYLWHPGLSLGQIMRRLSGIFQGPEHQESLEITRDLLELACRKVKPESIVYLEATEDSNPRRSFDINVYEARLQLQDLQSVLSRMSRHHSIPYEEFHALVDPAGTKILGHVSGGIHRDGKEFFCVYYGVEGRGG